MLRICFIRHGKTKGNTEGRYVGRTDEPLCELGQEALQEMKLRDIYPKVEKVFSSPMLRCQETAALIYPGMEITPVQGLQETDFGMFEYKNYDELNGNPVYQAWIDSNGTMDIPEAEAASDFEARVSAGLKTLFSMCKDEGLQQVACVAHGGVIMKLLSKYDVNPQSFYSYQLKNGQGYMVEVLENEKLNIVSKLL